jgi:hypothetical protein
MARRILVLSFALLAALGLSWTASVSAQTQAPTNKTPAPLAVPVVGTVSGSSTSASQPLSNGKFQGTATITQFANSGGKLVALGTLTGAIMDSTGNVVQSVAANFSAPVSTTSGPTAAPASASASGAASKTAGAAPPPAVTVAAAASCSILNLQVGAIHLDLLGLTLDTNQIMVNLTAVPGAGTLVGNLLCNVSHLLEGGNVNTVVSVLNQVLAAL